MSRPNEPTRRTLIGATAAAAALAATPVEARDDERTRVRDVDRVARLRASLAMASYSLRKFPLEEALAMTARLALDAICLKSFHLALDAGAGTVAACLEASRKSGVEVYGGGVINMKTPEEVDHAFAYARAAGMTRIVASPTPELLPRIDERLREHEDVAVCIHNHGPGDATWTTPEIAYPKLEPFDSRLGLCHDVGHTTRAGGDPVAQTLRYGDRIHDVHFKDVNAADKRGHAVPCGRGVIDVPALLDALLEIDYAGRLAFEYEREADDPLPGIAESIGYVRGVLDEMAARARKG